MVSLSVGRGVQEGTVGAHVSVAPKQPVLTNPHAIILLLISSFLFLLRQHQDRPGNPAADPSGSLVWFSWRRVSRSANCHDSVN